MNEEDVPSRGEVRASTLYVVATPIGNLGDLTVRAADVLRMVSRVVAEDTRRTRVLLTSLGIAKKPIDAVHGHSHDEAIARVVERLRDGESVALVTDAGTPAVSDPGDALVRAAVDAGLRVVPIPGACAAVAALSVSGLAGEAGFRFVGFLPRDGSSRREAISRVADTMEPVVLYEAPSRIQTTLRDLADATPERRAFLARELTKLHEEQLRGTLAELATIERDWLGEIVVVLGAYAPSARDEAVDEAAIDARIDTELAHGAHAKAIAERLAAWSGRPRRAIYERVIARRQAARGA